MSNTSTKIFLSASIPLPSRDQKYFQSADVIAIRDAVRALVMVVVEHKLQIVFGGHPAISPMIRLQIKQTGSPVGERVIMYQSRFFDRVFPSDNSAFEYVVLIDAIPDDRAASLALMRDSMIKQPFRLGMFIGGMEGVEEEYELFKSAHPGTPALPIASTGAAAGIIFSRDPDLQKSRPELKGEISYLTLMRNLIGVS